MRHRNKWWQQYQDNPDHRQMTNEDIAEACDAAADLLEGHWIQGTWVMTLDDGKAGYCLEGGLAAALGMNANLDDDINAKELLHGCPVYDAVYGTICEMEPDEWEAIPSWNDLGSREESEVIDLLRTTAKRVLGVGPDQMEVTA